MAKFITLPQIPTNRPGYVDPDAVVGIVDAMEMQQSQIAGAPPQAVIVGTILMMRGGGSFHAAMSISEAIKRVEDARTYNPFTLPN